MKNKVQLITYVNRLGGGKLCALAKLLEGPLKDLFGGIHLLPFFYPIDGEDAGFDPIDHTKVDPKLGDWSDIHAISQNVDIMADLIVNHMSADSEAFKDVLEKGSGSDYHELFLTYSKVFPEGAKEEELSGIYRPRPGFPFTNITLKNGQKRLFWTTFTPKQIDIDVHSKAGWKYLMDILDTFRENGISIIRLDAAGYAVKTPGTSCFMTPDTFTFISSLTEEARKRGIEVLVEIHSYYQQQIDIAKKVDWVYDFALPPLVLHTLFKRNASNLKKWFEISPRNAINVLDTHDGIGIVDIGSGTQANQPGLVSEEDLDSLVEQIHTNSKGNSRKATGAAASNLDLYQVNCTFFDALGGDPQVYLIARIIQFFAPGIPQVYYTGLLAGENDMDLLAKSGVGRDINRQYFSPEQLTAAIAKPVVRKLFNLIHFRNEHPAFQGDFILPESPDSQLLIRRENQHHWAELQLDLSTLKWEISFSKKGDTISIKNLDYIVDHLETLNIA